MTRVLLFGFGPLPGENLRLSGPCLRTWHFLSVLRAAGHEVTVLANRTHEVYPDDLPPIVTTKHNGWTYHSIAHGHWFNPAVMRPLVAESHANCAVSATTPASAVAASLVGDLPLWADLYGSIMAEAQLKALVYGDDSYLAHFWAQERRALARADIFSAVSGRQQWSVVGELGLVGRLNQWTSGYDFVKTIPIASETTPFTSISPRKVVRSSLMDENAFIILCMGGYNTWTDVDTLFAALENVLGQREHVVFVSTGGAIEGHDDLTFRRFQSLVTSSPYRDRYKLLGWVPPEDIPGYLLESNIAVNVDRASYEALLGSRTRVLDWLRAGLPCVLSSLTELSQAVAESGAGLIYEPGDAADLARCLLHYIDHPALADVGKCARQLLADRFTYERTSQPLLAWVANPTHAPDYARDVPRLVPMQLTLGGEIAHVARHRSLSLSLALIIWPFIARLTNILGLHRVQQWLAKIGVRALRLDRAPYRAAFVRCTIPDRIRVGEIITCPITVRNMSSVSWLVASQSTSCVNLAYHWLTPSGVMLVKEGKRTPLPHELKPGEEITLSAPIVAPDQPGRCVLALDLVREGVTWFSEVGLPGPTYTIEVYA